MPANNGYGPFLYESGRILPCRLQHVETVGKRILGAETEAPFQTRLHGHREDGKTRHPIEVHQAH